MTSAWGSSWGPAWGSSWGYAEQSARSGYWRLFFYTMQEEALKEQKHEKKDVDTGRVDPPETVARKKPKRKNLVAAKKTGESAPPNSHAAPTFRLAPPKTQPSVYEQVQQLIVLDPVPYTKARHNNRERITKQRKQRARRRAAAFLLLAA